MGETWDCIVVGAGVVGCCTAYNLVKQGYKTLLLEQFFLPHNRGSSNGQTRIIRNFYTEERYCIMMPEAFDLWKQIEKESGKTLFRKTGMLALQGGKATKLLETEAVMKKYKMPYQFLNSDELKRRFPMLRYSSDYKGILDTEAGILFAGKCLIALQQLIEKRGGRIQDGEKVVAIEPGNTVTIVTSAGKHYAKKVVLCPGPWAKDLLKLVGLDVPLKTMPGHQYYFRALETQSHSSDQGMPLFVDDIDIPEGEGYQFIYSKPILEYPGMVKVATRGEPLMSYCHPDDRDNCKDEVIECLVDYIKKHMPLLDPKPCIVDPCMYTITPDKDHIIDRHPKYPNIAIGAGMSGHGFKLAPVIGKLLTEIVFDKPKSYDLSPFKVTRFKTTVASKL